MYMNLNNYSVLLDALGAYIFSTYTVYGMYAQGNHKTLSCVCYTMIAPDAAPRRAAANRFDC